MIINLIIILILTGLSISFTPWYFGAIIALIVCFIRPSKLAFFTGFLGIGMTWLGYILYYHFSNEGILSNKMVLLFSESMGNWLNVPTLILLSVLIGSIVGAMGALSGKLLKESFTMNSNKAKRINKSYKLKIQ